MDIIIPARVKGWCAKCDLPVLVGDGTRTEHRDCDAGDGWIHLLYREREKALPFGATSKERTALAADILTSIRAQRPVEV